MSTKRSPAKNRNKRETVINSSNQQNICHAHVPVQRFTVNQGILVCQIFH